MTDKEDMVRQAENILTWCKQARARGLSRVTNVNVGEGGTKSSLEPEGQVYLCCVWHPPSMNTYCIAFSGGILLELF